MPGAPTAAGRRPADLTWLVAIAASFWGLSALWRDPLSRELPSLTIVFWEHALLTLALLPWLVPASRRLLAASRRTQVSVLVIGAGSSALATVLFTAAFRLGDPITPQVLQKLQPLIAIVLATLFLGERLRRTFLLFLLPALTGAWLLAFADPLQVSVSAAQPALLALGSAALWAAGTVLGRGASQELRFVDLAALRFTVGLVTLGAVVAWTSTPLAVPRSAWPSLVALAALPGLLAMVLYYLALGRTAASRATLAELAFPLTAALVGVLAFGARPSATQWLGMGLVVATVVALSLHEQSRRPAVLETDAPGRPAGRGTSTRDLRPSR